MWVNVLPVITNPTWQPKLEAEISYIPVQRPMRFES